MAPLTEQEQQARLGGAGYVEGGSCWRCIEYFKSGGDTDVTPHEAMLIAKMYYGDSFNASEYSFTGSIADMRECIKSFFSSYELHATGAIMVYDGTPDDGSNVKHAVVVEEIKDGVVCYYDPQAGERGTLSEKDFQKTGARFFAVK